jgi:GntR family transcriptional regulator
LQYAILSGEICSGENIPTIREMSGILHINSNTVLKSYGIVKQNGLITRSKNSHYTVTQDKAYIQAEKDKTVKELCCNYFSKMFELGFTKSEALMFMQDFSKKLTGHE